MSSIREIFASGPEFCNLCGSILPIVTGNVTNSKCSACSAPVIRKPHEDEEGGIIESVSYVVHFNDRNHYSKQKETGGKRRKKKKMVDGPLVTRDCKQCGNTKMSYSTLQLRSADEGQTVFFTCTKCQFKESENS